MTNRETLAQKNTPAWGGVKPARRGVPGSFRVLASPDRAFSKSAASGLPAGRAEMSPRKSTGCVPPCDTQGEPEKIQPRRKILPSLGTNCARASIGDATEGAGPPTAGQRHGPPGEERRQPARLPAPRAARRAASAPCRAGSWGSAFRRGVPYPSWESVEWSAEAA
jgi:hypothetical protein